MCVVFKPDGYKLNCPDIFLNYTKLNYVDNSKYLGVILNHMCKDDNDIQRHLRGLYARTNTLIRKFHKCTTDVKLTLFQAYCLPCYCSHLWARLNKYSYSKLNVAFNNVYRRILGYKKYESASHMFVTSHVDNFDAFMRKNVYGFNQRLRAIENNLVKCVLSCAYNIPNGIGDFYCITDQCTIFIYLDLYYACIHFVLLTLMIYMGSSWNKILMSYVLCAMQALYVSKRPVQHVLNSSCLNYDL